MAGRRKREHENLAVGVFVLGLTTVLSTIPVYLLVKQEKSPDLWPVWLTLAVGTTLALWGITIYTGWRPWPTNSRLPMPETPEIREGRRLFNLIATPRVEAPRDPSSADVVRTWASSTIEAAPSPEQIQEHQRLLRQQTYVRKLFSEGRGLSGELVAHREAVGADREQMDPVTSWFAEMAPAPLVDRVRDWSNRVRPVIVNSDELSGPEKGTLAFFPPAHPFLKKKHSIKILLDLIENHLTLLGELRSHLERDNP